MFITGLKAMNDLLSAMRWAYEEGHQDLFQVLKAAKEQLDARELAERDTEFRKLMSVWLGHNFGHKVTLLPNNGRNDHLLGLLSDELLGLRKQVKDLRSQLSGLSLVENELQRVKIQRGRQEQEVVRLKTLIVEQKKVLSFLANQLAAARPPFVGPLRESDIDLSSATGQIKQACQVTGAKNVQPY